MSLRKVATAYPHLVLLGSSYCLIKLVRYLTLLWLPLFLHEQLHFSPAGAGFASTAFDAGGERRRRHDPRHGQASRTPWQPGHAATLTAERTPRSALRAAQMQRVLLHVPWQAHWVGASGA